MITPLNALLWVRYRRRHRGGRRGCRWRVVDHRDVIYVEARVGKTRSRHAWMLGVVQLNLVPDRLPERLRGDVVAYAEFPDLRRHAADHEAAGDIVLGQFAFLGLAYPAPARELLQHTGALAVGIGPSQREPGP